MMDETTIRIIMLAMLGVVTYQTTMLRFTLIPFRAWSLITAGFIVFFTIGVLVLTGVIGMKLRLTFSVVGYALMALGLHRLRQNIRDIRRKRD